MTKVTKIEKLGFSKFEDAQKFFARIIGVPISEKTNWWHALNLTTNTFWVNVHMAVWLGQAIFEHSKGRGYLFGDCVLFCGYSFCATIMLSLFVLFFKHDITDELFEWCHHLYRDYPTKFYKNDFQEIFEEMTKGAWKVCRIIRNACIGNIFWQNGVALLTVISPLESQLPTTTYTVAGWVQEPRFYWILFFIHNMLAVYINFTLIFMCTTYIILANHIIAQLNLLIRLLEKLDPQSGQMNELIQMHADVIDKIEKFSELYCIPMTALEMCATTSFIIMGLVIVLRRDFHMSLVMINVLLNVGIYSHYGQQISDQTALVAQKAFESDWLNMSLDDKKKVKLIIQMAQKPRGVSAGGFHFVSYQSFSEIIRGGYSILLAIIQTVEAVE